MANANSSITIEDGEVLIKDGGLSFGGSSLAFGNISSMRIMPKQDRRFLLPLIGVAALTYLAGFILVYQLGLHEALEYDDILIVAFCCAIVAVVATARHKLVIKTASRDIWRIVGKRRFVAQVKAAIEKAKAETRPPAQCIDVTGGKIESL